MNVVSLKYNFTTEKYNEISKNKNDSTSERKPRIPTLEVNIAQVLCENNDVQMIIYRIL